MVGASPRKWWWLVALIVLNIGLTWTFLRSGPLRRGGPLRRSAVFSGTGVVGGTVTEDGKPVEQGRLSLLPEQGRDRIMFRSDSSRIACDIRDGRYKITGVLPGKYQARVETPDRVIVLSNLTLAQGSQTHDIALPAPSRVVATPTRGQRPPGVTPAAPRQR
jgi:hypothetical protein